MNATRKELFESNMARASVANVKALEKELKKTKCAADYYCDKAEILKVAYENKAEELRNSKVKCQDLVEQYAELNCGTISELQQELTITKERLNQAETLLTSYKKKYGEVLEQQYLEFIYN